MAWDRLQTANGSNMWRPSMAAYFSSLRQAASSAAEPASQEAPVTYDESASGQVTVTSQHSALPLCQGTSVRPSGLFPSDRNRPVGSLVTGKPADVKPRAIRSVTYWCRDLGQPLVNGLSPSTDQRSGTAFQRLCGRRSYHCSRFGET